MLIFKREGLEGVKAVESIETRGVDDTCYAPDVVA